MTPLTADGYLASKILTLTALSLAENLLIVVITAGLDFSPLPLVLGIALASALYCLAGFIAVVRYDSINELLFPTIIWVACFRSPSYTARGCGPLP